MICVVGGPTIRMESNLERRGGLSIKAAGSNKRTHHLSTAKSRFTR